MEKGKLIQLKEALEVEAEIKREIDVMQTEFELANEGLFNRHKTTKESIETFREEIKVMALEDFKQNNRKQLLGGIGIRVLIDLIYADKDAFDWAVRHGFCLQLDKIAFKKIAKAQELPFVTREEKVTVTFPAEIIIENQEAE